MATRARAPWVAAYVEVSGRAPLAEADRARLEAHLSLAESLGASIVRLDGLGVGEAVLAYARKHNITRIVLGKPTHARIWDRLRGSLLDELVRGSEDIDVHVISGDDDKPAAAPVGDAGRVTFEVRPYLLGAGLVALMTAAGWALREVLHVPDVEMLYLVAVMFAALRLGRGPSIFAAALSVAAYDFFFVPPYYTLAVRDGRYVLTFTMMFGLGFVMSALATRVKRQEKAAREREERTRSLYALSRDLGASQAESEVVDVAARQAAEAFGVPAVLVENDGDETAWPRGAGLTESERGVSRWAREHRAIAGLGTSTLPGAKVLCVPLAVGEQALGVLALRPEEALSHEQRTFLETFARQIAFALERVRLTEEARQAALKAKTEELRSSLLSAVSHDLRTPLGVLTGTASTLRDEVSLSPQTQRELLDTMVEEAERLERLVANLLDMTRLEGGELALKREWVPLVEIVGAALSRLEHLLGARPVHTDLPDTLPLVSVDPVLLEQLFINLLENAIKYTPVDTPFDISARVEPGTDQGVLVVEVRDHGPGIPAGDEERIFERFFRGVHVGKSSAGLGLAICRAIAEAHGGSLTARNAGGAVFELRLPLQGTPPTVDA
jgi:two-component system sensor histidine kinase KdpD